MSFGQTVALAALAGFTIFLGLPVGRLELISPRTRVALAMFSVGILAFIFVDVLEHANEIVGAALDSFKSGSGSFGHLATMTLLLIGGFTAGSAGLGFLERSMRPAKRPLPPIAGGAEALAFTPGEVAGLQAEAAAERRRALQTGS